MEYTDMSQELIHWIKGDSYEDSFNILRKIVFEHQILGGNGQIRGGFKCVCFTEAPTNSFHALTSRYQPFGICVSKRWVFEKGGRPVIYQPDSEYNDLGESYQWRHVRYEPNGEPPVDFLWEREWRLQVDKLELLPGKACIVVPDESWAAKLLDEHRRNEEEIINYKYFVYGEHLPMFDQSEFYYDICVLDV